MDRHATSLNVILQHTFYMDVNGDTFLNDIKHIKLC